MLPPCGPGGTECGRSSPGDGDAHDPEERREREPDVALGALGQRQLAVPAVGV